MKKTILNVEGMSCSHCVNAIKQAVSALEGVNEVSIDLKEKTVTVEYEDAKVSLNNIKKEIEEQGYDVN